MKADSEKKLPEVIPQVVNQTPTFNTINFNAPVGTFINHADIVYGTTEMLPHVLTKYDPIFSDARLVLHREEEVNDIQGRLKADKASILLSGFGGIGKTSIAHVLYSNLANSYDSIGWVEYRGDLKQSLLAALDIANDIENQQQRWDKIVATLKNDKSRKLLIIDNVDKDAEQGQDPANDQLLLSISSWPNLSVLLTSRLDSLLGYDRCGVGYLGNASTRMELCSDLFYYYYSAEEYRKPAEQRREIAEVEQLVKLANYHTYAIELLAKSAKYESSLAEYLIKVKNAGFSFQEVPVKTAHKNAYAKAANQLKKLFDLRTRTERERQLLWDFSVLPNTVLTEQEMKDWLGYSLADVDQLASEGWVQFLNGFYLHPLVKETILLGLAEGHAPIGTAKGLSRCFSDIDFIMRSSKHSEAIRKLDIAENYLKYVSLPNDVQSAKTIYNIGRCLFKKGRRRLRAIVSLERSLAMLDSLPEQDIGAIAEVSYQLGYIESATEGYRKKCIEYLKRSLELREIQEQMVPGTHQHEIASACDHLGYVLTDFEERYGEAEDLLRKALAIRKALNIEISGNAADLATTYDNLGWLLSCQSTRMDEAEEYLLTALSLREALDEKYPSFQTSEVAWTCNNLGVLYRKMGRYEDAELFLKRALALRQGLEKNNPGLFIGNIAWTCSCFAELYAGIPTRREDAAFMCHEVIELCEKLDDDHRGFFIKDIYDKCTSILAEIRSSNKGL